MNTTTKKPLHPARLFLVALTVSSAPGLARAADIIAADQPGLTDSEKLQSAIDTSSPGDTIYLSSCVSIPTAPPLCPTPKVWIVDGTTRGKLGVTYDGASLQGPSTLKLVDFDPATELWSGARWRDVLAFQGPATPEPTVIQDVIIDGNRDGQHFTAGMEEPKQEGLFLTADSAQEFIVDDCVIRNSLWVGLLAWHHARVTVSGLSTSNNHNALQLGGHQGNIELSVDRWISVQDRVAYRGEIESALGPSATVHGRIANSTIVDATAWAFSFNPKANGEGAGSSMVLDNVHTSCVANPECRVGGVLIPREAEVQITNSSIGRGGYSGYEGLSLWIQYAESNIAVQNSQLGGYVHVHSVGPNFDSTQHKISFTDVDMTGSPSQHRSYVIPGLPLALTHFVFFTNRNLNLSTAATLHLELQDVRVDPGMGADGLLHLYGGAAQIDSSTFVGAQLPMIMAGSPGWYSSTLYRQLPGYGGYLWSSTVVESGYEIIDP